MYLSTRNFSAEIQELIREHGIDNMDACDAEIIHRLCATRIKELPTKLLPKIEDYDTSRHLLTMFTAWMETEDADTGFDVLHEMRELVVKSMAQDIMLEFENQRIREQDATEEQQLEMARINYAIDQRR